MDSKTTTTFKTVDPTKVERMAKGRPTKYEPILEKIMTLKGGEGFLIAVPAGAKPSSYRNRVQIATRMHQPEIPEKTYIATAVTADEKSVLVELVKGEKPVEKRGRPPAAKKAKAAPAPVKATKPAPVKK